MADVWIKAGSGALFHVEEGSHAHANLLAEGGEVQSGTDTDDLSKLKVAELQELAAKRGIEVPEGAKKADLVELLEANDAGGETLGDE